jgi:hypothetical protein
MSYAQLAHLVTFRPLERGLSDRPRRHTPFKASWTSTVELLAKELRAHGARQTVLEFDFREQDLRLDGLPYADKQARSPGIVLSFEATAVQANVRAVALGLEALRAVDRYGVTRRGEQYAGWKQLESGGPSAERGRSLIREHGGVREALMATHPDHGGPAADFADVQAAR